MFKSELNHLYLLKLWMQKMADHIVKNDRTWATFCYCSMEEYCWNKIRSKTTLKSLINLYYSGSFRWFLQGIYSRWRPFKFYWRPFKFYWRPFKFYWRPFEFYWRTFLLFIFYSHSKIKTFQITRSGSFKNVYILNLFLYPVNLNILNIF